MLHKNDNEKTGLLGSGSRKGKRSKAAAIAGNIDNAPPGASVGFVLPPARGNRSSSRSSPGDADVVDGDVDMKDS